MSPTPVKAFDSKAIAIDVEDAQYVSKFELCCEAKVGILCSLVFRFEVDEGTLICWSLFILIVCVMWR